MPIILLSLSFTFFGVNVILTHWSRDVSTALCISFFQTTETMFYNTHSSVTYSTLSVTLSEWCESHQLEAETNSSVSDQPERFQELRKSGTPESCE